MWLPQARSWAASKICFLSFTSQPCLGFQQVEVTPPHCFSFSLLEERQTGTVSHRQSKRDWLRFNVFLGDVQTRRGKEVISQSVRSIQSLSHVQLFTNSWTAARQASLSITNSRTLLSLLRIWELRSCKPIKQSINLKVFEPKNLVRREEICEYQKLYEEVCVCVIFNQDPWLQVTEIFLGNKKTKQRHSDCFT